MVMAGVDTQGRLTACESDGLVMVGDRKVIEATASVMAFALDGKPIEESEAVVLLPQPEVSADFICRLGKKHRFHGDRRRAGRIVAYAQNNYTNSWSPGLAVFTRSGPVAKRRSSRASGRPRQVRKTIDAIPDGLPGLSG